MLSSLLIQMEMELKMQITTFSLKRVAGIIGLALASLVFLSGCQLADMVQFSYANSVATHHWVDEAKSTTVHFELIDGHIVLPVSINGSAPLNFVLDSGAAAAVILESRHTTTLSLELGAELPVSGVGTGPSPVARVVKDTTLSLGSVRLEDLSVIYLPLESVPFFNNFDEVYFDGVIGAPFFERFVVEIDYDRQLISFSEPDSAQARIELRDDDWREIPLQLQSGVPYITTQISIAPEQSVAVKLLVDTGYRGPVSLIPETHSEIHEPGEYFSTVGQGLSGDVQIKVGMSESFSLADFELNYVPVSYSISGGQSDDDSNGLLGNEVLSHFNVVFDYPNERMFVKPNQQFAVPISADRSGLLIRPHRLGAVVKSIARGALGRGSELRAGDIITSIDDTPMTRSSISKLKQLLASERETVSVCWQSGEQAYCEELALASRFEQHEGSD
ncbi:MAG: putative aspartyl protease [Halioglobus sp.]|jgi:predicted aspartyl protease